MIRIYKKKLASKNAYTSNKTVDIRHPKNYRCAIIITTAAVPGEVLECQTPVTVELFRNIFSQSQIQESL